jgi:hypothetical protein
VAGRFPAWEESQQAIVQSRLAIVVRLLTRAVVPTLDRNHLFSFLPGRSDPPPGSGIRPEYRLVFPIDVGQLRPSMLAEAEIGLADLQARAAVGDLAGVIFSGHRVVHRSLVQTSGTVQMEGDRHAFRLAPGQTYIHYCQTSPLHRGRRLYPAMLVAIVNWLASRRHRGESFISCRTTNRGSINGVLRAGFAYRRSSVVAGLVAGRLRWRRWYVDASMETAGAR